jgi:hypothetical protein
MDLSGEDSYHFTHLGMAFRKVTLQLRAGAFVALADVVTDLGMKRRELCGFFATPSSQSSCSRLSSG